MSDTNRSVMLMSLSWLFGLCCAYQWGMVPAIVLGWAIGMVWETRKGTKG